MRLNKWPFYGLLLILAFLSASPLLAKWYFVKKLEDSGYQVELKKLGLNVFTGGLGLYGLQLTGPQQQRLNLGEAQIDVEMMALFSGQISIQSAELEGAIIDVSSENAELSFGGFSLKDIESRLNNSLSIDFERIAVSNSEVCSYSNKQCLHLESLIVGRATLSHTENQGWFFQHNAPLYLTKAFLRDLSNDVSALYLGKLDIAKSKYSKVGANISDLKLRNFQLVQNYALEIPQSVVMAQTQVGEMSLSSLSFEMGTKPDLRLGDWSMVSPRQALIKKQGYAKAPFGAEQWLVSVYRAVANAFRGQGNLGMSFNSLSIQSGILSWQDSLVFPRAKEQLTSIHLDVGALDNRLLEKPAPIKLTGKIGSVGPLSVEGYTYPVGPSPVFNGKVKIQDWDLSKIEAYTDDLFGHTVKEGTIDLVFDAELEKQSLKIDSQWLLTNFVIDDRSRGSRLSQSLNLLKDRNQSVRFKLPLSGAFPSKKFTLKSIFSASVPNALASLSQMQLSDADAELAAEGLILGNRQPAARMTYRPIVYQANVREPEDADVRRLWDIAETLKSKPHLVVSFCAVGTVGEWAEVFNNGVRPGEGFTLHDEEAQRLNNLSAARVKHLKQELVDQGVPRSQMRDCKPVIDLTRMELSFVTVSM